jgi:hypothetical protein
MIDPIENGESGLSARTKINQAISKVNYAGTQLLASASVNLNLPDVSLTYPRLSSGFDSTSNVKLTYAMGPSITSFIIGEYVTDDYGNTGIVFYDSASTMSLAYTQQVGIYTPFTPGLGFTGSISTNTATVVTAVSGNLLTPGESIVSVDLSSSATVVTSQSGSYLYGVYSELTSVTGSFKVSFLQSNQNVFAPWQPGETINDTTSGASATFIYANSNNSQLVVKNISGTFTNGDTISGSLSSNSVTLAADLTVGYYGNVVVGQTSKVAFPIDNYFTSSYTDTTITLSGGSTFVVTDVLMTNGVGTYVSASDGPYLFTEPYQGGNLIAYGVSQFNQFPPIGALYTLLQSPNIYINNIGNNWNFQNQPAGIILPNQITVGSTLYYSNVPNSSSATADVYVYGYILS